MSCRYLVLVGILALLVACGARTHVRLQAPAVITADRVELEAACTTERRVATCPLGSRSCTYQVVETPAPCPEHEIEVRTGDGRTRSATLEPSGEVVVALEPRPGPPYATEELRVEASHSYRLNMLRGDLVVLGAGGLLVFAGARNHNDQTLLAGLAITGLGYHIVAPIIHARHGNPRGAALSAIRRFAFTAAAITYFYATIECGDSNIRECGGNAIIPLAWTLAVPLNVLIDLAVAEVEYDLPLPTVSASRDGAVIGLGGTF